MKTENYTSVCLYCGTIYKSVRHQSKFCHGKHRSLHHKYGPRIDSFIKDKWGTLIDADERLREIDYNTRRKDPEGWSYFYNLESIESKYEYDGPLPKGDEIVIVGSYAVEKFNSPTRLEEDAWYGVKHISNLTVEERAKHLIIKG